MRTRARLLDDAPIPPASTRSALMPAVAPALLPAVALLAACNGEAATPPPAPSPAQEVASTAGGDAASDVEDCLLVVWENQTIADREFDRSNDTAEGGAISCATDTSPSQYAMAVDAIRLAARSGDRAGMLREVGIPLLYIDAEGNRREMSDPRAIEEVFDEVFDEDLLRAMRELDLKQMTVENRSGGYFSLGALWLRPDAPGGRPRIVTINRQALAEARASDGTGLAEAIEEAAPEIEGSPR